jgi:HEAT repeat protein
MGKNLLVCFLYCGTCFGSPEEAITKKVYAHLQVGDFASACAEAEQGFESYPHSTLLFEANLKALSKAKNESMLWSFWNKHATDFVDSKTKREILECIAWNVIENGSLSSSPLIRILALLAAYLGNDAKGVDILYRNMNDSNSLIRATAVKLAGSMRDIKLQKKVLQLLQKDKSWNVRFHALKAVGEMKIIEAKPKLLEVISSPQSMAEEKEVAIEALVNMLDDIDRQEIAYLAKSSRAGLRQLACQVVEHLDRRDDADLLLPLFDDYHPEVRAEAYKAIGLLRLSTIQGKSIQKEFEKRLKDLDPLAAITAAWGLTLHHAELGLKALAPWLEHRDREVRLTAAAALASTGKYGISHMRKAFLETKDAYIRMNIALGLISQRVDTEAACAALYEGLSLPERWMWKEDGHYKALAPSTIKHDEMIPNYPESMNQMVRLDLLNTLAIMKYPKAPQAIRAFLKEKNWGISGMASAVLLTEGDEEATDLVKNLLEDRDQKIRIQAALVLSQWGRGEDAISVLIKAYDGADREMKEQILESLGKIRSHSVLSFLTEKLQENYPSLRIIAAAALLQSLYN